MSSFVQGYGQWQSGMAQSGLYNQNAYIADQNSRMALETGSANEDAMRRQNDSRMGSLRASLIDSGNGLSGTSSDILQQSAQNTELDALNTRYKSILEARAYKNQASQFRAQADMAAEAGNMSLIGGLAGAATSALMAGGGGGYSVAGVKM